MVTVPVFVMLRPRRGLDFVYSPEEIEAIKIDARVLREAGADGFVFGALTPDGSVDERTCREIMEVVSPLPATFHRAIDMCVDMPASLEAIIRLGFHRVLTSGGETTAEGGVTMIRRLTAAARGRIVVMPGAGITRDNLASILGATGAREFHGSAKVPSSLHSMSNKNCKMGSADDQTVFVTSSELVLEMIDIASQVLETERQEYLTGTEC